MRPPIPGYAKNPVQRIEERFFEKISMLLDAMNQEVLGYLNLKPKKWEVYAIDYVSELLERYRTG